MPPEIPYQRAVLFFTGDREMLVVQSKYSFPGGDAPAEADGWSPSPPNRRWRRSTPVWASTSLTGSPPSSPRVRRYGWLVGISVWCAILVLVIVLGWR